MEMREFLRGAGIFVTRVLGFSAQEDLSLLHHQRASSSSS